MVMDMDNFKAVNDTMINSNPYLILEFWNISFALLKENTVVDIPIIQITKAEAKGNAALWQG